MWIELQHDFNESKSYDNDVAVALEFSIRNQLKRWCTDVGFFQTHPTKQQSHTNNNHKKKEFK